MDTFRLSFQRISGISHIGLRAAHKVIIQKSSKSRSINIQSTFKIKTKNKHGVNNQMNQIQQIQKQKKSKIEGEVGGFTCFLVYFVVKAIILLILYKYDNLLKHEPIFIPPFIVLLIVNTYLMLTTGSNPGFQSNTLQENELLQYQRNQHNYCSICNCRKKNRTKHCYLCGRCVRKFDHHCPWIGACVGESNHFKFWTHLLTHTLQASLTFYILFRSIDYFVYKQGDGSFNPQYGVYAIFSLFMLFYIGFAGCLLVFHGYLLISNQTSREMLRRRKCIYLSKVKGNPFSQGIYQNLKMAIYFDQKGRQWLVEPDQGKIQRPRTWTEKLWENDYYSCC